MIPSLVILYAIVGIATGSATVTALMAAPLLVYISWFMVWGWRR